MSKKRKGQDALKSLQEMWEQSNTEEKILQEIQRRYGNLAHAIFRKGKFVVIGDWWVLLLDEKTFEALVEITQKFFFELGGVKVKPWTGDVSKLYRAVEVGKWSA